jgi:glutaredoxin
MTEKLKPCPFCGRTPDADSPGTFKTVEGHKFGAVACCRNGPEVRTFYALPEEWRDKAIKAWNERGRNIQ